jgi:hypothetical protein
MEKEIMKVGTRANHVSRVPVPKSGDCQIQTSGKE